MLSHEWCQEHKVVTSYKDKQVMLVHKDHPQVLPLDNSALRRVPLSILFVLYVKPPSLFIGNSMHLWLWLVELPNSQQGMQPVLPSHLRRNLSSSRLRKLTPGVDKTIWNSSRTCSLAPSQDSHQIEECSCQSLYSRLLSQSGCQCSTIVLQRERR